MVSGLVIYYSGTNKSGEREFQLFHSFDDKILRVGCVTEGQLLASGSQIQDEGMFHKTPNRFVLKEVRKTF